VLAELGYLDEGTLVPILYSALLHQMVVEVVEAQVQTPVAMGDQEEVGEPHLELLLAVLETLLL